jgi:uncharacterized protein YheU (UPF0270 family)
MKTQNVQNLAQDQSSVLEEISRKTMNSKFSCGEATPIVQEEHTLTENFCASIIQLDSNICSVTRTIDQSLENAQRCWYEDDCTSVSEELGQLSFVVRDLTERYQYELTSNQSYHQLKFSMNHGHLTVLVNNPHVDVVNLADRIAELAYRDQTMSAIIRKEQLSSESDLKTAISVLHRAGVS